MEVKKNFTDSGASTSKAQSKRREKLEEVINAQETDPLMLTSFLHTCMELLRDQKEIEGLQELIENSTRKGKPLPKQHAVHKVEKGKKMIG